MDEYARNFYREKIKSGDDLVWYGRVETERHYKGDDPEVEAGRAKAGELFWYSGYHWCWPYREDRPYSTTCLFPDG